MPKTLATLRLENSAIQAASLVSQMIFFFSCASFLYLVRLKRRLSLQTINFRMNRLKPPVPALLLLSMLVCSSCGQFFFPRPTFDCSRIHPRYCCTSRVRESCPQLCAPHPCNAPFMLPRKSLGLGRPVNHSETWTFLEMETGMS